MICSKDIAVRFFRLSLPDDNKRLNWNVVVMPDTCSQIAIGDDGMEVIKYPSETKERLC